MTDALLSALEVRANSRGLVLVSEETLHRELLTSHEALPAGLARLEADGSIEILTPLPFLVVKLRKWSGKTRQPATNGPQTGSSVDHAHSYSFHNQSIDKSKAIAAEEGSVRERASLLQEILTTLGESDPTTFRAVLEHYPTTAIRAALSRVRATPPEKLRKSRTALFRFLIAKNK